VYLLLGVGLFLGVMLHRIRAGETPTVKRQARLIFAASILSFAPIVVWLGGTLLTTAFTLDLTIFLFPLILFPLSVAIAILRYRLLEIDALVHRAILYGAVTAILAGVMSVASGLSQKFFLIITGQKSDLAVVITTLIVVSAFEPIRARVRAFVDKMMAAPDHTRELRSFGEEVRAFLQVSDAEQLARRLLEEAARSLKAESGVLSLFTNGQIKSLHTYGAWRGEAWMSVPIEWAGERYGLIALGPRQNQEQYTRYECEALQQVAGQVASAIQRARAWHDVSMLRF
jgi:hypothetical protein